MSYSSVDICNLALAVIGSEPIRSLDDTNKRARMCYNFYPYMRDYLLYKYNWPFAQGYVLINEITTEDTIPEGEIQLQLPSDCMKPYGLHPPGNARPWRVSGNTIITPDTGEAFYLYYTKLEVKTGVFTMAFVNALYQGIAMLLAHPITGDKDQVASTKLAFSSAIMDGGFMDTNIGSGYKNPDDIPDNDSFVNPPGLSGEDPFYRERF
jgi:hypothetical protein